MLWLLSLMVAYVVAQGEGEGDPTPDCDVSGFAKTAQKRRECAKRSGCKWSGQKEDENGNVIEAGSCNGSTSCASLPPNKCKKRNDCYLNWAVAGNVKPCVDYNPGQQYPCAQLAGKKNRAKCKAQSGCINGSGKSNLCLDKPENIEDQPCNTYSGKGNKNLCVEHSDCYWDIADKECTGKHDVVKTCSNIDFMVDCQRNHAGCTWTGDSCVATPCSSITDRTKCNRSKNGCQWYRGFTRDDFDAKKNKEKQRADPGNASKKNVDPACRNGVNNCSDILVENFCKLAATKHNINGCHWNAEAKEITGATMCSTTPACSTYTDSTACQLADNMDGGKCVWQVSGDTERCMEFSCDADVLDTKNKCNTVGCHWHRNKDKRDPTRLPFCGDYDVTGRRL